MKIHESFMAILSYLVTILLFYLIGDAFGITFLQFTKETHAYNTILDTISHSIISPLLALPIYLLVRYKTKQT